MKKKLAAALVIITLVVVGASAQLMLGISAALPLDTTSGAASTIQSAFDSGNGLYWGPMIEIAGDHLGVGASVNTAAYRDDAFDLNYRVYDLNAYLSVHLFGPKKFLDPFVELGGGLIGTQNDDNATSNSTFLDGSYYWDAAAGLGVNLSFLGVFAKLSYNGQINESVRVKDDNGDSNAIPRFGNAISGLYLSKYRFTLGAKLIL